MANSAMTKEKYTVYLICKAINKGRISIVEAANLSAAKQLALSINPGYALVNC
jgi:hypothetical protein